MSKVGLMLEIGFTHGTQFLGFTRYTRPGKTVIYAVISKSL